MLGPLNDLLFSLLIARMPEYPDVELYLHALRIHICQKEIRNVVVKSPFLLRTFDPPMDQAIGQQIQSVSRIGKRIVWHLSNDLFLVFHLMISGRYHRRKPGALPCSKTDLAVFQFDDFSLMLTEAGKKKRASLHVVRQASNLEEFDRGGLDVTRCDIDAFEKRILQHNKTVKLALIDPTIFDGIGNAYSDEILHAADMSPFARTNKLKRPSIEKLFAAIQTTLQNWRQRLIEQTKDAFPEKVTAFRPEMAVHGKFGQPCPVCNVKVQRIRFSEREWNYCPGCQTNGKLLADRSLSRLLKDEWPSSIEELAP